MGVFREVKKRPDPWKDPRFMRLYNAYISADGQLEVLALDLGYLSGYFPEMGMPTQVDIGEYRQLSAKVHELRHREKRLRYVMRKRWV